MEKNPVAQIFVHRETFKFLLLFLYAWNQVKLHDKHDYIKKIVIRSLHQPELY